MPVFSDFQLGGQEWILIFLWSFYSGSLWYLFEFDLVGWLIDLAYTLQSWKFIVDQSIYI